MQVKKQQLERNMEQLTGSKLGKEYVKTVYCHPAYSTYMQSTSCEMVFWMNHKLGSKLLGEIPTTSDMQTIHSNGRRQRRTIEPLDEDKEESKKADLKLYSQKTNIMASGPITSWQLKGKMWKK